ncbi:hypothetical protein DFP72DRAFT_634672 [Ephemerocybe angulata]|uniref:Ion transport domain-containing protein n=1 Tax=Ephemerocybe angulata TaxID=980116 RepID=A0A8H6LZB1_9AGAR|nr:hypothetical protein DFP72DRAFT_634672 [Tulosesus angulatus]
MVVCWSFSWSSLFHWVLSFYGIIDLLSVLPYYIELMLGQDTSILRTFRLLRVFRPFRYNHTILLTIEVMYLSVRRSQHALLAIGFFVVMILTVFSTLLYFAERGTWGEVMDTFINSDGDPTQFASIPAAAWFVIVTITTVGYCEITPRSFLGRLITLPILVFGLLLITLPSFLLGREFSLVWAAITEDKVRCLLVFLGFRFVGLRVLASTSFLLSMFASSFVRSIVLVMLRGSVVLSMCLLLRSFGLSFFLSYSEVREFGSSGVREFGH